MTIAQLRAFAAVVRYGSVRAAAAALGLTEPAVSMHIAQLRKELEDQLFRRTSAGLAFTPGGLRLGSRAVELLGLQERTMTEVARASSGMRLLRIGATSLFAEHAAPGLIDAFTQRADDLEVELSVHPAEEFETLLRARAIDVAIGPPRRTPDPRMRQEPFLAYDVELVAAPGHPLLSGPVTVGDLAAATWLLGPSAIDTGGTMAQILGRLKVPEDHQRIFQSDAAALEALPHEPGIAPAVIFSASADLTSGRLVRLSGHGTRHRGMWVAAALDEDRGSTTAELMRFLHTPRATRAMLRGAGVPIKRFRPAVYVTLWS